MTSGPLDATRLVREALKDGVAGVAVVGGDGTLNEAVNGFFDEDGTPVRPDAWLGPLPCGTGGDFRRTVGISRRPDAMVTQMLWARPRPIDVGWITFMDDDGQRRSRAFINIASFGLAGVIDRVVNNAPKWMGPSAYLLGTMRSIIGFSHQRVVLSLDDEPPETVALLNGIVANGRFFGGGMKIAPRAEIDDGLFEVITLEYSRLDAILSSGDVYRGQHLSRSGVGYRRARRVRAEPENPSERVLLDIDGEAPGALPATFEVREGAVLLRG